MSTSFSGPPQAFGLNSDSRHTTAQVNIGLKVVDKNGAEWRYVKAGATIAQYDGVKIAGSALGYDNVRPTAADDDVLFGVASAAFASADYGFVQVSGVATCKVIVSTAAASSLVPGGTAGTLKLAVTASLNSKPAQALVTGVAAGSAILLQ